MTTIRFFIAPRRLILLPALLLVLVGCQLATDEVIEPPFYNVPTIITTGPTSGSHRAGGIALLQLSLSANGFLRELRVSRDGALVETIPFTINDGSARNLSYVYSVPAASPLGSTQVVSIVLVDRQGQQSAPFTYTITVSGAIVPSTFALRDTTIGGTPFRRVLGRLNQAQTLPAGPNYLALDTLSVVDGGILTLDPGVTLYCWGRSATDTAQIVVGPESQLVANGTSTSPVVFTSLLAAPGQVGAAPGDWGGIVITGLGGTTSSGSLRFVRIEYAGSQRIILGVPDDNRSIRMNNVGSGTTVEYLQTFRSQNDGIRVDGGAVNLRRILITDHGASGIRWQNGWTGFAQFIVVHTSTVKPWNTGLTRDIRGEATSSFPRLANITLLGPAASGPSTARGFRLESGPSRALVIGMLVTNYPNNAIRTDGASAFIASGEVRLSNCHTWNGSALWHSTTDPMKNQNGNSEGNNAVGTTSGVGAMNFAGIFPGSMLNPTSLGPWFESAPYAGAVDPANDWTANGTWARNADGSIR